MCCYCVLDSGLGPELVQLKLIKIKILNIPMNARLITNFICSILFLFELDVVVVVVIM